MKRLRRILHPSDFSAASRPAFHWAVDLARTNNGSLMLVHVIAPVIPLGNGYVSPETWVHLERQVRAHAQREVDKLVTRARKAGVRASGFIVEGTPADQIVRAARARRANVIVMGTRGRGGLAKLFLGSVAERVVATASCPVLTVRAR